MRKALEFFAYLDTKEKAHAVISPSESQRLGLMGFSLYNYRNLYSIFSYLKGSSELEFQRVKLR